MVARHGFSGVEHGASIALGPVKLRHGSCDDGGVGAANLEGGEAHAEQSAVVVEGFEITFNSNNWNGVFETFFF